MRSHVPPSPSWTDATHPVLAASYPSIFIQSPGVLRYLEDCNMVLINVCSGLCVRGLCGQNCRGTRPCAQATGPRPTQSSVIRVREIQQDSTRDYYISDGRWESKVSKPTSTSQRAVDTIQGENIFPECHEMILLSVNHTPR